VSRRKPPPPPLTRAEALEAFAADQADAWDRFVRRLVNDRRIAVKDANAWRRDVGFVREFRALR
jgi:hypothetical protein